MADSKQIQPTPVVYGEWQRAYDYFNEHLFKNELPPCLITLHRHPKARGYFSQERFLNRNGVATDEIALNPEYFALQSPKSVMSTLCHEMAHAKIAHFGKDKSRQTYHNTEWADLMTSIGLEPSSTGMPGGKRVGQKVTHYIIKGGPFDVFCDELLMTGDFVSWFDRRSAADADNSHFIYSGEPFEPPSDQDDTQSAASPSALDKDEMPAPGSAATGDCIDNDGGEPLDGQGQAPQATIPVTAPKPPPLPRAGPAIAANLAGQLTTPTARKAANGGKDKSNRVKFVCGSCEDAAWGKPTLVLICGNCMKNMEAGG